MARYAPKFEAYRDRKKEWRWRMLARNGNIVADSGEGYDCHAHALRAIRSLVRSLNPGAKIPWETHGENRTVVKVVL